MTDTTGSQHVQLLVYRFSADASFEGRLVGALERMESGGTLRIVEALFIAPRRRDRRARRRRSAQPRRRQPRRPADRLPARSARAPQRRPTKRSRPAADALRELGAALAPGTAIAALLVEHTWARTLADAVAHSGGTPHSSGFVDAATLSELAPMLAAAASATGD